MSEANGAGVVMNRAWIEAQRAKLRTDLAQLQANWQASHGALQLLDQMEAELLGLAPDVKGSA